MSTNNSDDLIVTWLNETDIMFEHADLKGGPWMNFSGAEGRYNREGDRNFHVVLPDELAMELKDKQWYPYFPKEQEVEDEEDRFPRTPSLETAVQFNKGRPPAIYIITSANPDGVRLTKENVGMLDVADMANVDLIVHGYLWHADGRSGYKAYLKTMYVTLNEDPLQRKYAAGARQTGPVDGDDEFDDGN